MWTIETTVEKAVADGVVPGVVMLARDRSGKLDYARALGQASLDPADPRPMGTDTVFALASMTKLLTSIAALQLVDRGLIALDTDVGPLLPTLAAQPVLTGFAPDSGEPLLAPRTRPIRLRHLLTHSSGIGYPFLDPRIATYLERTGRPVAMPGAAASSVEERFAYPLLFEPGTGWAYGASLDWVGRLVEVLSGLDLDTYMQQNLLAPLGIAPGDITFYPERGPAKSDPARMARFAARDPATSRLSHAPLPPPPGEMDPARAPLGGEGGFANLSAYLRVLHSLLVDDGALLQPATAALLFEPWLGRGDPDDDKPAKVALLDNVAHPEWIVGWVPPTGEYDHGLGGLLVDGDGHPFRRRGYLAWSGVFNLNWVSFFSHLADAPTSSVQS